MEKKKFDVEFHGTNLFALVPLLLFVVFCILFFVVFKTFDMMHLCMGGYVALIIGSLLSKNWGKYWDAVATGMSSKIMNELALILLIVGMFGKLMTRGGVAQGFVWLGDKIGLSGGGFVAFTFIATCVIATATGTSIGTMFTAFPILYPSGLLLGADPVFLAGAILSGAIFGDNVGPISDTTIASASTQEYTNKPGVADVAGVVGSRMKYALVAAAAATVCFALFGGSGSDINAAEAEAILAQYSNPKGLIMLIPVAILLIVAFIKRTMSPAYIPDMVRKLEKAMAVDNGLVYLHVYNPCVTGWGCKSDESIEVARLAVETNFAPLYEVENGVFKMSVDVKNPKPVKEFVTRFKKFRHLTEQDIEELQEFTDRRLARLKKLCGE